MTSHTISVTIIAARKVSFSTPPAGPQDYVGRDMVTVDVLGAPQINMTTAVVDFDADLVAAVAGIRKRFLESKREAIRNHHRGQHGVQGTVARIECLTDPEPESFRAAVAPLVAFVADAPDRVKLNIQIVKPSAAELDYFVMGLNRGVFNLFGGNRGKTIYAVNDPPENREPPPLTDGKGTVG